jgi:hypothetical protein
MNEDCPFPMALGTISWVVSCPISKNTIFQVDGLPMHENGLPILFHSQGINCLNQFLGKKLNDWVHETKWVVGGLWVSPLTHGLIPLAQGFE